jgi:hypothetical protein
MDLNQTERNRTYPLPARTSAPFEEKQRVVAEEDADELCATRRLAVAIDFLAATKEAMVRPIFGSTIESLEYE